MFHTTKVMNVRAGFFQVMTLCMPLAVPPMGFASFSANMWKHVNG